MLPRFNDFLGCCPLRSACLTIGWMSLVYSVSHLFINAMFFDEALRTWESQMDSASLDDKEIEDKMMQLKVGMYYVIFIMCAGVLINASFLRGIYKKNTCLMLPWMIIDAIACAIVILCGIVIFFVLIMKFTPGIFIATIFIYMIFAFKLYISLTVYNHFLEIKEWNLNVHKAVPFSTYQQKV